MSLCHSERLNGADSFLKSRTPSKWALAIMVPPLYIFWANMEFGLPFSLLPYGLGSFQNYVVAFTETLTGAAKIPESLYTCSGLRYQLGCWDRQQYLSSNCCFGICSVSTRRIVEEDCCLSLLLFASELGSL